LYFSLSRKLFGRQEIRSCSLCFLARSVVRAGEGPAVFAASPFRAVFMHESFGGDWVIGMVASLPDHLLASTTDLRSN